MSARHATITLPSPQDTTALAVALAPNLRAGDVLLLDGPLGAGKTHFARALIQTLLPAPEDVPSPTFTLVQSYDGTSFEIWHSDLYRLTHPDEVIELGVLDAFETALCLIEWPDRLQDLAPADALTLSFAPQDNADMRQLTFTWVAQRWKNTIESLLDDQS